MMAGCVEARQALGVYVVGAIEPAERALVDQHLGICQECRDELAGLAGLPALLGRVTLDEVERASSDAAHEQAPPERLLNSMLAEMARQQRARRRRNVWLAAAAAVVILAGAGGGVAVQQLTSDSGTQHTHVALPWTTVRGHSTTTKVTAEVKYLRRSWGTQTSVSVSGVPYGTRCTLWVTDSSGHRAPVGSWDYKDEGFWYPGSTSIPTGNISSFEITAHNRTLVTLPAA